MLAQWLVVAALVAGCGVYAAWTLLPAAVRRRIALAALAGVRGWPAPVAAFWRRHAQAASGCGCDGCDAAPLKPGRTNDTPEGGATDTVRPITFHPRRPR